jgi:hypothetical protein
LDQAQTNITDFLGEPNPLEFTKSVILQKSKILLLMKQPIQARDDNMDMAMPIWWWKRRMYKLCKCAVAGIALCNLHYVLTYHKLPAASLPRAYPYREM